MNRLDFEIIKNVIQDNSRVLDVGCETGELSAASSAYALGVFFFMRSRQVTK